MISVFVFSSNVITKIPVDNILKFLVESALETDRRQSYKWHFATKENPVINKRLVGKSKGNRNIYYIWEENPFVAGTSRKQFDKIIDVTKDLVNAIPENIYQTGIYLDLYTLV
ncbi:MAG: hypothetical protein MI740_08865 [Halanaerobiales bacterium]|nr:hypothetical protein [Halanaerobiales bacterium]